MTRLPPPKQPPTVRLSCAPLGCLLWIAVAVAAVAAWDWIVAR